MQLALLGGGRMGEALLGGLLEAGWDADSLAVAEIEPERRRLLEQRFQGVRVAPSPAWAVAEADVVVVAVKPGDVTAALDQCLTSLKTDALVLSIATINVWNRLNVAGDARGGGPRPSRRAGDAEHRRARPQGRGRDRCRPARHRCASRRGRTDPRRRRCGRARSRDAARRPH